MLRSIQKWTRDTFGPAQVEKVYLKVMEEMGKLAVALRTGRREVGYELADIVITLTQLANAYGVDLESYVQAKMDMNKKRTWKLRGDGTGDHV